VWGGGVPLPNGGRVLVGSEFFFAFGSQNGEFWCILGRIFTVELLFTAYGKLRNWSAFIIGYYMQWFFAGTD